MRLFVLLMLVASAAVGSPPDPFCTSGRWGQRQCIRVQHANFDTCQVIAAVARDHGIPAGFFARLIWQESRFDFNALSPAGAQGIAQFMPDTAKLHDLSDTWDPARALDASARYLADLTRRYGNPGLAAMAYNGGERRADGFVSGSGDLAAETRNYVRIITGLGPEDWRDAPPDKPDFSLDRSKPFLPACLALAKSRRVTPFKTSEPPHSPWGVQLAAGDSRATALKRFRLRVRGCRAASSLPAPEIIRKKPQVRGRRAYFVARIGQPTRAAANKLCNALRRQACACAVYRN